MITCHSREKNWIDMNKETRNYITGRINEELGSFISTIIATILREGFRWNITQDNSKEEIGVFKYLILITCETRSTKGNYQEWHNTTSKDMRERIALRIARWRKLELLRNESWWTLREGIKSLMNYHVEPLWRTPVNKRITKMKRSWKHKVKPCNDLDGSPW